MDTIMNWLISMLYAICSPIAALFVAKDSLNFELVQMAVAIILIASVVMLFAYRQQLISFFLRRRRSET
jgi:uncharacterized membrane protein